jgi:uncharacterized membrane protein YgaE (UPF0421/DUF939 family)
MRVRSRVSPFTHRGEQLLDAAARRSRDTLRGRIAGLRAALLPIAQTAIATGISWGVAAKVVGHREAFFAPISAVISLGVSQTQRLARAVELVLGVAVGLLVADILVFWIGTGVVQIVFVVALAMLAAVFFSGRPLLVSQAATSAVLVAALTTPSSGLAIERFIDALIGGAAGLLVYALLPGSPSRQARRAAKPIIEELSGTLEDVATALERRDLELAEAALDRARGIDRYMGSLQRTLRAAAETARVAPIRWHSRGVLAPYIGSEKHIRRAVGNVQVLARRAIAVLATDEPVPPLLIEAIRDLAATVRGVGRELASGERVDAVRESAQRAAAHASVVLGDTDLSGGTIVAQVRSTAVDLLRGLGTGRGEAQRAIREAAARARKSTSKEQGTPPDQSKRL